MMIWIISHRFHSYLVHQHLQKRVHHICSSAHEWQKFGGLMNGRNLVGENTDQLLQVIICTRPIYTDLACIAYVVWCFRLALRLLRIHLEENNLFTSTSSPCKLVALRSSFVYSQKESFNSATSRYTLHVKLRSSLSSNTSFSKALKVINSSQSTSRSCIYHTGH